MSAPWDNLFSVFACCRDSLQGRKFDPNFYQNALDAADICGIGIMFKSDMSGALFVSSVVPDGPAHKAGNIMEGDVLFEVDGVNVYRCPASQCASSLMGPRGSKVRICFLRRGTPIEVTMVRDFVQSGERGHMGPGMETLNPIRNPAFSTRQAESEDLSRGQSTASSRRQSDHGGQSPPHRWDGLWDGRGGPWWSPDKGRLSPDGAASRLSNRDFAGSFGPGGVPVAAEELERIKQKLDRQERWAETLGPNSPFVEPVGRSGRRSPPNKSPRQRGGVAGDEFCTAAAVSRGFPDNRRHKFRRELVGKSALYHKRISDG